MSSHETTSGDSVSKKSTDQPQPNNRYDDVRTGQTAPMDRAAVTTQESALSQDPGEEEVLILGTQSNQAEMKDFMALTGSVKLFKNQKIHETKMIYKGEKTTVGESVPVVVKLMENTNEALREAKSLHSIEVHPNVVRIYDSGVNDKDMNLIYIVMELCSEETLNNYINQNDFNLQLAIRHCTQIIDGLCYIHSKKIVHRDLKPDNILFSLKDGHNQVKITDFGVSKNYITDPQATSKPFGTMGYVAPEIITSEKPSDPTKCDIFSLGVLLAFILSNGKHPYGDEPWQWNFNIAAGKDPNLNEILVPEGGQRDAVLSIILSMLQRNPDDRPTADDALKMWLRDVDLEGDVNFRHQPKRRRIDGPKSIQTPCIIGVTQQDKEFNECNELICWNSIEEMEYDPMIALDMPEVGSLSYTIYGHVRVFYVLASDLSCRKLDLDDVSKGLIKLDSMKHDHGLRPHATFLNGKLYVCGSRRNQGGQISKKCEVFDGQWSEIADLNMARNLNTVVSYDGCLYSVGGLDEEGNPLSSVEKYDPAKNTWVFITSLNVARRGPYAIVYNGKMHVLCGTDENGKVWIPSFERFDPSTSMWTVFTSSWWKNNKPVFPFIFDNKVFSVSYDDAPGYRNIQQVPLNNEAEEDLIKVQLPRRSKLYRITSAV